MKYGDPDGRRYKLCVNGDCTEYSDKDVDDWRKQDNVNFKDGKIFNSDGKQIGTYQRTWFDNESQQFNEFVFGMAARAPALKQAIGIVAVTNLAVPVTITGVGLLGSSGLTTLGIGTPALTLSEGAAATLASQLQFTATTAARYALASRWVPLQTLANAILYGTRIADPQGAPGAVKIVQEIFVNGKKYNLEIIYREADKVILHFLYK